MNKRTTIERKPLLRPYPCPHCGRSMHLERTILDSSDIGLVHSAYSCSNVDCDIIQIEALRQVTKRTLEPHTLN